MIAMVGNLRKRLSVVVVAIIAIVAATIYFNGGAIFQYFPSNFLMAYCLEISKQNLITKVSYRRLLTTPI
jgi:hypothetical protein